jgi:hypothetical protein
VDPDDVGRRRLRALERLAVELRCDPNPELETALIMRWRARAVEPAEPAEAREARAPESLQPPPGRSRRAPVLLLLIVIGLAVGVTVLVSALGGDDEKGTRATTPAPTTARTAAAPKPPPGPVRLQPLPGIRGASGTARLAGRRLELRLRGLAPRAPEGYTAWLYSSIADAVAVARFSGDGRMTASLPRSPRRYRFIDISQEPADGNPNHSGISLLRVPVASLLR